MKKEIVVGLYDSCLARAIVDYAKDYNLEARAVGSIEEVDLSKLGIGVFDLGFDGRNLLDMSRTLQLYQRLEERIGEGKTLFVGISKFPQLVEEARRNGVKSYSSLLEANVPKIIEGYSVD